ATTSTPVAPVAPGPRFEKDTTSASTIWLSFWIESQPVPPNCVDAPTLIPTSGAGFVVVPKPGPPLPVEKIGVVRVPSCQMSASWLNASKPSLSSSDGPYEFDVTSIPFRVDRK